MKLIFFAFIIGITPAYLNEEVQKENTDDPSERPNHNCPNHKVLVQALNILKENLVQDGNKVLSPEKFKNNLETLIDYLDNTQVADADPNKHAPALKNIMEKVNNRSKKEVLRMYQQGDNYPSENLSGKFTLQYELPTVSNGDCHTLFRAIVNAINAAYLQMSVFCADTGKCELTSDKNPLLQNLPISVPSYQAHKDNLILPPSNKQLDKSNLIDLLKSYPQNTDIMTLLQNHRPYSPISVNVNKFPNAKQANSNSLIHSHGMSNDLTRGQKNPALEAYNVLNRPSGYYATVDQYPTQPLLSSDIKVPYANFTYNLPIGPFQIPSVGSNDHNQHISNVPVKVPEDFNNLKLNVNLPEFPTNSYTGYNNILPQRYLNVVPNIINGNNGYKIIPNYQNYDANFVQQPQENFQTGKMPLNAPTQQEVINKSKHFHKQQIGSLYNQNPYPGLASYHNQASKLSTPYLPQQKQSLPNQFYSFYQNQNPQYFTRPEMQPNQAYNQLGIKQIPTNQRNVLVNQQILGTPSTMDSRFTDVYKNHNNTDELHDLYRLTSMTNGPKLNIAPNKNGIVELTFTLQRPQSLEYKPVYYVKYRLPYQTYMYNVENVQKRPFMRNNPAQLYQELLAVANITESSQDLKDLDKAEISKLVATSGALVKAKVLDDSSNSVDVVVEEEVKNILKSSAIVGAEGMLNATKMAVNNIEEAVTSHSSDPDASKTNETVILNSTAINDINESVNTRSLRNLLYTNPQFIQRPINRIPSPSAPTNYAVNGYNNMGSRPILNGQMLSPYTPPINRNYYQQLPRSQV